jgi:hypothetical protein
MAGLVPAIHVFAATFEDVDARVKPGHDASEQLPALHLVAGAAKSRAANPECSRTMRAEIERLVEEIKQSVGLLRRHL